MVAVVSSNTALVRGRVARFTLLDNCGYPLIANSMYVTDGFITVKAVKNVDTGDEVKVRLANGVIGVHEPGQVSLLNLTVDIQLAKIDPAAIGMLSGDPLVLDYAAAVVGWEEKASIPMLQNFAMEVWTGSSAAKCTAGSYVGGYMLYPWVGQGYVTLDDITDKEVTATIHGVTSGNPSWGKGPYGALADGSSVRGPVASAAWVPPAAPLAARLLQPVDPNAHRHFEITPIPPPPAFVVPGPQSITLPSAY